MTRRLLRALFWAALTAAAWGPSAAADETGEVFVRNGGRRERVTFFFYLPPGRGRLPVLVCTDGVPSDGARFMEPPWKRFADAHGIAVLSLGFTFVAEDWEIKRSYQYPQAWSGRALRLVLRRLARSRPLDPRRLYLFGVSAGAQFSTRFALLYPRLVRAVAAHAAGGYNRPPRGVGFPILLTVGERDEGEVTRVSMAKAFARSAKRKGIDISLEIVPGIAHRQTEGQDEMSRQFFAAALRAGSAI